MKKIVITGAAGFLGSHLAQELIDRGNKVIGIDNFSTGHEENVMELLRHENYTFLKFDVTDPMVLELDELFAIEEIFHLASPASPKFYQEAPFETIAANTIGTKNMLDLAYREKASFLYTSTSEAYGDPEIHPQPETYRGNVNTWGPRACYDESKRLGEVYCYEYFQRYQIQAKVVRLFNTYSAGLRNDDGRVISNFVTQAISGEDITVYGDGSQTRSFCYVDDMVSALLLTMKSEQATGQIINLGNPTEYTILEVANLVKRLNSSNSKITFLPLPCDDPKVRRPMIDKAKRLIKWEPKTSLEEGLQKTIASYTEKRMEVQEKVVQS
ncbi:NAD-dependent epimerase/dehydratase family protein [Halobacillus litoralis]|uniref:NAD-dependent epimerase/dehydratase family protein n=1 Tax=Halobacillus litoralis TaxID=45668 RepID=UPI001CFEFE11|nr:NAD-dependent epimerase/dehydratase family protein [Halobacillus litoralis]